MDIVEVRRLFTWDNVFWFEPNLYFIRMSEFQNELIIVIDRQSNSIVNESQYFI